KTFQINKAPVTATAGSGSAAYDGLTKSPSACAVTGAYTGGLTCANNPALVGPAAGTTTITPVVSGTGLTNFDIALVNGSFTISAASSVTTVSCPASVSYNGSALTPCTVTVTGSGILGPPPALIYTNNINVGTATASASFAGDANHTASSDSKTFQITKAAVTATAGSGSAIYDGSIKSPAACTITGDYTGGLTCANNPVSVGPAAGTATASASFAGDANHNASSDSKTFQISKVTLTVTADNKTRVYGASNPTFTASYSGFVGGQTLATSGITGTPALNTPADVNSPIGTYPIVAAVGTLSSVNYNFTFVDGTLTITKATLTITALNISKTYGDVYTFSNSCPSINCSITGLAPNDSIAGVILTSPGAAAGAVVGTYPVTVTG